MALVTYLSKLPSGPVPSRPVPSRPVPSLALADGSQVAKVLQERLNALNDPALTLKHIHWNVVGPRPRTPRRATRTPTTS